MNTAIIYAYECAPFHRPGSTIGAQRPYQFAKHLPKFGWRAIVLCCDYSRRYSLDPRQDWKAKVQEEVQKALDGWDGSRSLTIPLPSLQYADEIDRIWLKSVVMDPVKGVFTPKFGVWNGLKRKISTFFKLFRGDHSQSWQKVAVFATEIILKNRLLPKVQIAAHGPDASLFVASKFKHRIPAIFDFRDPVDRDFQPFAKIIFRNLVVKKFSFPIGTVNVNSFWAFLDEITFRKPSIVVSNGFDYEEFTSLSENLNKEQLTFGWFGNIQSGQDIQPFFQALKRLNPPIKLKILYRGGSSSIYLKKLKHIGDCINLDFADNIPRDEALRLMHSCDILLLLSLLDTNVTYLSRGLIPGKTFEYLATLKPILVVPGDGAMLDNFISENNFGKIGRNVDEIVSLIQEAYYQKQKKESIWGIQYQDEDIMVYSRESQTEKLATFMDKLLSEQD